MVKEKIAMRLCLGFWLITLALTAMGQGDAYRKAVHLFETEQYREAHELFLETGEEHAMSLYYRGRCLLELNSDLAEAIEDLHRAAARQAPSDVTFYQGRAHHLNYNFKEALKYYQQFEAKASRQEVKDYRVKQQIYSCRSALSHVSRYNPTEVLTVAFMNMDDSLEYSQIRMKGGQLQRKPMAYRGKDESGPEALMFFPKHVVRGDYLYYASRNKSGKDGMQLYRVRKGSGRSWGDPQEIKALNTEGNEILPYFDPIENNLYYASDGRDGVGGYDLYRTHYDAERDTWTSPMNLGFPVNSARDEVLLLPGTDLGMMMIFSDRQGTDSTYTVYRVHLVEPQRQVDVSNNQALAEIASLGGAAEKFLREMDYLAENNGDRGEEVFGEKVPVVEVPGEKVSGEEVPERTRSEEAKVEMSGTQFLLSEALFHQAKSDSLKDLSDQARIRVRESDDPNDRWVWQKQILVWEKRAADEEAMADALYERLDMENSSPEKLAAVNPPEPVVEAEEEPEAANEFDIESQSPYTSENPIPIDAPLPSGVLYRIQLGAFGQQVDPAYFGGIRPISAESHPERQVLKYYAGRFSSYDAASLSLEVLRNKGFEDAFIVSWYGGRPVSVQKAKQLE